MASLQKVLFRVRALLHKDRLESEMDKELRFHLERQIEDNVKAGLTPKEARYAALRTFGGVEQVKEQYRHLRGVGLVEELGRDFRYGARVLLRSRGFTLSALLALAMGIAANTAIFSVIDGVVFRPLRFEHPERLVRLFAENLTQGRRRADMSPANFVDWKKHSQAFEGIAAIAGRRFSLTGSDEPEMILAMLVTADFFPLLRAQPQLGRVFVREEYESEAARSFGMVVRRGEEQATGEVAVILSYGLWQRRFGGRQDTVGSAIELDGRRVRIAGVMPRDFAFTEIPNRGTADCWIPQAYAENENPRGRYLSVIARFNPSVSLEQAQAETQVIARRLEAKRPEANAGWGVRAVPLHETIVGDIRKELMVFWGAVGFVILIACANTANLLLARAAARQREMAVRTTLGASRRRLVQQLLTESILLAVVAGLAGFLMAAWGVRGLLALAPENLPRLDEIGLNRRVFSFTLLLSVITGVFSGLVPALRSSKSDLSAALKEGGAGSTGPHRRWLGSALVVSEIALTLMLLIGAGLMLRSFLRLQSLELGYNPRNVLTVGLNLSRNNYPTLVSIRSFNQDLIDRIEKLPGVQWAAVGGVPLLGGAGHAYHAEGGHEAVPCGLDAPTPNYFRALGTPLLRGRFFADSDNEGTPPVAIVNRAAAERSWPAEDPIGKRFTFDSPAKGNWITVVGVVESMRSTALENEPRPDIYLPLAQSRLMTPGNILLRTEGDPLAVLPILRGVVRSLDKDLPLSRIATMEERMARATARRRFNFILIGTFSALALVLAMVGLYSVMAYAVTRRTHEIGIRMALGARQEDILQTIIGEGMILFLLGMSFGLAAAFSLNRTIASMLYGITPTDPVTYAGVSLVLAAVTVAACYFPARRAAKIDPLVALRYE
jgi:putative ABC transport system permease protein